MRRLAWTLLSLLTACGASSPEPEGFADGGPPTVDDGTVTLEVDPPPPTTVYGSVPITGRGPANGRLKYDSPVQGPKQISLGNDGGFCVDIPLNPGVESVITFEASDAAGNYSDQTQVSVRQDGEAPDVPDPVIDGTRNIAYGAVRDEDAASYKTSMGVDGGTKYSLLTDGTKGTSLKMYDREIWPWSYNFIAIRLKERASIHSFKMTMDSTCPVGDLDWSLSNLDNPDPWVSTDWTYQSHITDVETVHAKSPSLPGATAKWMMIWFNANDCSGSGDPFSSRKVSEIEVFTSDGTPGGVEPPENPTPTCANGR